MDFHGDGAGDSRNTTRVFGCTRRAISPPMSGSNQPVVTPSLARIFVQKLGRLIGGVGHQNMVALLDERQNGIRDRRRAAGEEGAAGAAFQLAHRFLQGEMG